MRTKLITTTAIDDPITIKEARMHLRNPERTDNDAEILWFIQSAKRITEHKLGRTLMAETWEVYLNAFPAAEIELPYPPLSSVTSVKYYDTNNSLQILATTEYVVDKTGGIGRLTLPYGKSWPSAILSLDNAVTIQFVAGYASADDIPQNVKHYMKLLIGEYDKNRELTTEKEVFLSRWAEHLLDPDRVLYII